MRRHFSIISQFICTSPAAYTQQCRFVWFNFTGMSVRSEANCKLSLSSFSHPRTIIHDDGMCCEVRSVVDCDEKNFYVFWAIGDLIYFCDMNVKKFESILLRRRVVLFFTRIKMSKRSKMSRKAFNIVIQFRVVERTLLMFRSLFASQPWNVSTSADLVCIKRRLPLSPQSTDSTLSGWMRKSLVESMPLCATSLGSSDHVQLITEAQKQAALRNYL